MPEGLIKCVIIYVPFFCYFYTDQVIDWLLPMQLFFTKKQDDSVVSRIRRVSVRLIGFNCDNIYTIPFLFLCRPSH